jgi:hypothetical protein
MGTKLNQGTRPAATASNTQEDANVWVQGRAPLLPASEVLDKILVQPGIVVIVASSIGDLATPTKLESAAKYSTAGIDIKALHVPEAHLLADDMILAIPESVEVDGTMGASLVSELGMLSPPTILLHDIYFGPWKFVTRGSFCVNAKENIEPQLFCNNTDKNNISSFKSGIHSVLPSATSWIAAVELDCICWVPDMLGSGTVQPPWPPPQISTHWLSSRGIIHEMMIDMKSDELQRHYSRRRYSDGDQVQPILMLSISVPLDLGVCNKVSIELLKFELRKQRNCGEVLVTVPCDYSALSLCICTLYQDHLGKHPGVQHLYIPYITYARSASYCLIQL